MEGEESLKEHIADYFYNIFSSEARNDNEEIIHTVQPKVTEGMNNLLCADYTEEEVKKALYSIGDLKAPGLDGMLAVFFKRFWQTIGDQLTKEVLHVLRGGDMPDGWNDTLIVLIPKNATPVSMKDLRPISLCNVVYKLVAKVITNRLKLILPDIISPNQSAFVPGRLISDNILLAYELTHFLQRKRSGPVGYAAIKLDMSKAYDRVEWSFLRDMMERLGFDREWIKLIMKCISTVKYQIKVNKDITDIIYPQRGLRQGDPLSPYLFLICAEGFSAMIHEAELNGSLKGIMICREAPCFSHLLFADDSLLLMEANANSAQAVNRILNTYEAFSGQMINKDKSSILFSKNTRPKQKEEMKNILHITSEGLTSKYLGVPSYVGKSKARAFEYVKDRMWKKIQGWKEKLLSKPGKEILIKAVAQAIPVYLMACFDLSKSVCEELSTMINRYWWSQMDKENKIHWASWEKLMKTKRNGGLGFRDLHLFNLAMLARQAWRLLQNPSSLCAQVLLAKYYPNSSILEAERKNDISYTWRSILKGVQLLKKGIIWRVGTSSNINIWSDPWIPRGSTRKVITQRGRNLINKVNDLIDPATNSWDEGLVKQILLPEDAEIILKIPIQENMQDFIAWHFDKKGIFSVKSAYRVAADSTARESPAGLTSSSSADVDVGGFNWHKLWTLPLPSKVLHFLWRLSTHSLPLRTKLHNRGMKVDTRCPLCFRLDEDGGHCFIKCKNVKEVWRKALLDHVRLQLINCDDAVNFMDTIFSLNEEDKIKTCILLWCWWHQRNRANVGDTIKTSDEICSSINYHVMHVLKEKKGEGKLKPQTAEKWSPPPPRILKVNTDGSFKKDSSDGGWGFVIRDEHGEWCGQAREGHGCTTG